MRFQFISESIINQKPYASVWPDLPAGSPPVIRANGRLHPLITASSFRGALRRSAAKHALWRTREINPTFKYSSESLRMNAIGGVKGSTKSIHPDPNQVRLIRELDPNIDIFGCGDPAMISGALLAGLTLGIEPPDYRENFGTTTFDPSTRLPIIRRSLLQDATFDQNDVSDPEKMMEDAVRNRTRVAISKCVTEWKRLNRKTSKGPLSAREQKILEDVRAELNEAIGREVTDVEDAAVALEEFKTGMLAEGTSDVAEANLHPLMIIPQGTEWTHQFELHHPTMPGLGLFMAAWDDKYCFSPFIGANSARGCGGYLHSVYQVSRQEDRTWIPDCTISVKPDEGVTFDGAEDSIVKSAFDEWKVADISRFSFDFNEIKRILEGGKA
jgi:hypothetical protein